MKSTERRAEGGKLGQIPKRGSSIRVYRSFKQYIDFQYHDITIYSKNYTSYIIDRQLKFVQKVHRYIKQEHERAVDDREIWTLNELRELNVIRYNKINDRLSIEIEIQYNNAVPERH